jgi:creatinine amidohydrolase
MKNLHKYENLTWKELDSFNRNKTVIIVPIGLMEEHSLQLPIGTDAFMSQSVANDLAKKLSINYKNINFLIFPLIPVGFDCLDLTGTVQVRRHIFQALIYDVFSSITKYLFKYFIISCFHGGTENHDAIKDTLELLNKKSEVRAIDIGEVVLKKMFCLDNEYIKYINKRIDRKLTQEEIEILRTDLHAGFMETSLMLHLKPSQVRKNYKKLNPYIIDVPSPDDFLSHEEIIKIYRKSEKDIKFEGHWGYPAKGNKIFGKAFYNFFIDESFVAVKKFFNNI